MIYSLDSSQDLDEEDLSSNAGDSKQMYRSRGGGDVSTSVGSSTPNQTNATGRVVKVTELSLTHIEKATWDPKKTCEYISLSLSLDPFFSYLHHYNITTYTNSDNLCCFDCFCFCGYLCGHGSTGRFRLQGWWWRVWYKKPHAKLEREHTGESSKNSGVGMQ